MAASIRHSSAMLRRIAIHPAPARCFTTTTMNLAGGRGAKPAPRSNPLIGSIARPARPATESQPADSPSSTPADTKAPPPPPPPPSRSATMAAAKAAAEPTPATPAADHTYSATSKAAPIPFEMDIMDIISNKAASYGRSLQQEDPQKRPRVRAVAATGRTVFVRPFVPNGPNASPTLNGALNTLGHICKNSHVKNKSYSQKFHERKGLKRKRLRSERWRTRFKAGFVAAYARVGELRKQGW